jgi:4-diphosphocytidyl-2-C-methyl-D-erythritol kinase
MLSYPNAKINIGLNITEKRTDGFHNIISVFHPIDWCDALEIIPAKGKSKFHSTGIKIPGGTEQNLCLQAHRILQEAFDIPNVEMHLHKLIPIGAGLGGGSADAAFTLKMLNDLFTLNLKPDSLIGYARQLGSDCAFFIKNDSALATEKGDVFQDVSIDLSNHQLLVVNPQIHIGTSEAYSGISPRKSSLNQFKSDISQDLSHWKNSITNDFEASVFPKHKEIKDLKDTLYQMGATYVSMTGSGSTVYGFFKNRLKTTPIPENYVYKWV